MIKDLESKLKKIKLIALDFDGTLTVGAFVISDQDGKESVICSRRDSLGIDLVRRADLEVVVISKEINKVVLKRCQKIGIKCWQGVNTGRNKLQILEAYAKKLGFKSQEICYGGDDVNDIACIRWSGFGFTVKDGHELCKKNAMYVTKSCGGQGAVREVCEKILQAQNKSFDF